MMTPTEEVEMRLVGFKLAEREGGGPLPNNEAISPKQSKEGRWAFNGLLPMVDTHLASSIRNLIRLLDAINSTWCRLSFRLDKDSWLDLKILSPIFDLPVVMEFRSHDRVHMAWLGNFVRTRVRIVSTTTAVSLLRWVTREMSCGSAV